MSGVQSLLLLSGGLDSAALAHWQRPAAALWIDYGQRPAGGERRAAVAVANAVGLPVSELVVDASAIGLGLLHETPSQALATRGLPSPEWWPYRNQLLVTVAAAWAWPRGYTNLMVGSVATDGERHVDGTPAFYEALSDLVAIQEGGLTVTAPAVAMTTLELIKRCEVPRSILGWTHSCHVDDLACGNCPGCAKHEAVLVGLDRDV